MKLIIFLIIIIIIYLILTNVKVVHIDSLPSNEKKELDHRSKMRSILLSSSYIKAPENDILPIDDFISIVKMHNNHEYQFNPGSLPVNQRYLDKNLQQSDKKYLDQIKNDIQSWNSYFHEKIFGIVKLIPTIIIETDHDFLLKLKAKLQYFNHHIYLQLVYYGEVENSDTFDHDPIARPILVGIRAISENNYNHT